MPDECISEMRAHERTTLGLLTTVSMNIANIMLIDRYGSMNKLLRVTTNVLKFIQLMRNRDIDHVNLRSQAEILWIVECQSTIEQESDLMHGGNS
jgi:hypothetical protein